MLKWLFQDSDPSTLIWSRYRLLDENDGDLGGAGTGDAGDGSQIGEGEHAQQQQDQGGMHRGASDRRLPSHMIPKYRFDEVNQRYRPYRELGLSPEDIKQKLARLEELERQPQNYYTDERKTQVREDLMRVFPELQSLVSTHESNSKSFVSAGVAQTNEFLKSIGIEATEKNNRLYQNIIGGFIQEDPEMARRFYARDRTVFADAIKAIRPLLGLSKRIVPGLDTARGKTPLKQPAAQQAKPNGETKPEIKPGPLFERQVLDEAGEAAFARISNFEE